MIEKYNEPTIIEDFKEVFCDFLRILKKFFVAMIEK